MGNDGEEGVEPLEARMKRWIIKSARCPETCDSYRWSGPGWETMDCNCGLEAMQKEIRGGEVKEVTLRIDIDSAKLGVEYRPGDFVSPDHAADLGVDIIEGLINLIRNGEVRIMPSPAGGYNRAGAVHREYIIIRHENAGKWVENVGRKDNG